MPITKQEINSVIKLSPKQRYEYFIKKVADYEELFTAKENGKWLITEGGGYNFFMLWSSEEYANLFIKEGWEGCVSAKITLDEFMENIIPIIKEEELLLSIFALGGKSGFVVSLDEFKRDLSEELDKYM